MNRKIAFTLAEVLITLGIIGIVAALTIPQLIAKHKKVVVSTALKKFSTSLQNSTIRANYDNGEVGLTAKNRDFYNKDNPEQAAQMLEKYYKPYMAITSIEEGTKGAFAYFQDGSAMYFRRFREDDTTTTWSGTYVLFCPNGKDCRTLDESNENLANLIGKKLFVFYNSGNVTWALKKYTRDELLEKCKNPDVTPEHSEFCTALIIGDNWEIKSDYPRRFW